MTEFNIWLLMMPFIIVSLIFGVSILFARKKYRLWFKRFTHREKALDIIMLTKNKNVYHGVVAVEEDKFSYKQQEYMIDEEAIYTEKFRLNQRPYSFYLEGNPKPLKFDFVEGKANVSSKDLKALSKSKLIQQLLETKEEAMTKIILIVLFMVLIGLGILGYMLVGKIDTNAEAINLIKQVLIK